VVVTFSKTENEIYKTKQMEKVSSFSLLDMWKKKRTSHFH
jgi:hypothetical protein